MAKPISNEPAIAINQRLLTVTNRRYHDLTDCAHQPMWTIEDVDHHLIGIYTTQRYAKRALAILADDRRYQIKPWVTNNDPMKRKE